jgi:hypothetical protein
MTSCPSAVTTPHYNEAKIEQTHPALQSALRYAKQEKMKKNFQICRNFVVTLKRAGTQL